jgi:hypothetical protein
MPTTLGVTPPDDDKLLAVQAFRFQPGTAVGLVAAVDALRHDAFEAMLASSTMECRAVADLVIGVPEAIRRTLQQRRQSGFAVDHRQRSEVLIV